MFRIVLIFGILFAPLAAADSIVPGWRMADIPAGTAVVNDVGDNPNSILFTGEQSEGGYLIKFFANDDMSGSAKATYIVDGKGQRLHYRIGGGEFSYRPHNCARTLGTCRFTVKDERTDRITRLERNLRDDGNGRFSYTLYTDGQVFEKGWFIQEPDADTYGIPMEYYFETSRNSVHGKRRSITIPD